jgi:sugar phosphate isomerase/epimerase
MQIGAMNHPARNPLEEIDWFGRHGFDFVDFTLEPPAADPGQIDPKAIRAALDRHGLGVVAHTAWFIPIGSPFGSVREASLAEFRRALWAARQIGAAVMNVHYGKSQGFFSKEQVVGWHVEVLSWLCQEAEEVGMTEAEWLEGRSVTFHRCCSLATVYILVAKSPVNLVIRPRLAVHFDIRINEEIEGRTILLRDQHQIPPH